MPEASPGRLFILSGPSGVGKDAVIRKLKAEHVPIHFTVTATSRRIRPGEVDGEDYVFLTQDQFQAMIDNDGFLEWVSQYGGDFYGTPKRQVLDALAAGQDVLLKIETQGAEAIKKVMPRAIRIFLAPPSIKQLEERLMSRGTESATALKHRLEKAEAEMACAPDYDYLVINHDSELDATVEEIQRIISKRG